MDDEHDAVIAAVSASRGLASKVKPFPATDPSL
jgi:hypothetical protein